MPLKSFKNKITNYSKTYHVRLGEAVTQLLLSKANNIIAETSKAIVNDATISSCNDEELSILTNKMPNLKRKIRIARNILEYTKKLNKESVADIGQITTISKQRIIMPQKTDDILANIIIPNELLREIDKKINYLYCNLDESAQE